MASNKSFTVMLALITLIIIAAGSVYIYTTVVSPRESLNNLPSPSQPGSTGCAITPSFNAYGIDALVANSNVSPANYGYIVDNVYKGGAYSPVYGKKVVVLADPTGYLADVKTIDSISCDKNDLPFSFYNYANATVTIKEDVAVGSGKTLTNDATGGATNATAITSGGSANFPVILTVPGQKSTGKIFTAIELPSGSSTNVTSQNVVLSCSGQNLPQVSIPSGVTSSNTNSLRVGFEIPAVMNGATVNCNLYVQATASKSLSGAMRLSFFGEQKFIDADGSVKEGIYDLNSNAKYQDTYTYSFFLK